MTVADVAGCDIGNTAELCRVLGILKNDYDAVDFSPRGSGFVAGIKHFADKGVAVLDTQAVPFPLRKKQQLLALFAEAIVSIYAEEGIYFPDVSAKTVAERFGLTKHTVTAYRDATRPDQ